MDQKYSIACDCGSVELWLTGQPREQGFCHCEDCRIVHIDDDLPKRP